MRPRLLLIDVDARRTRAYRSSLGAAGFGLQRASSLDAAAGQVAKRLFDVVIVDVRAGACGLDALLFVQRLRRRWGARPVIVLAAYGEPAHAPAAARFGADVFLHKPVSLIWLGRLLRERLEQRPRAAGTEALATG